MIGKNRLFLIISILLMLLSGCNNGKASAERGEKKGDKVYFQINETQLTNNEKNMLEKVKQRIKLANQITKESDTIIREAQSTDDLEGALDIMAISKDEVNKLLLEFQSDSQMNNGDLLDLQKKAKKSLEKYTEGIKLQEEGINDGDGMKNQKGFVLSEEAKKEIEDLSSLFKD
ncbi:hypothetical protein D0469_10775 [Peribacillus saganii]|uniref:Lipoprotein n=1 Tax=Peribacillus saganii TaxID=2303992 RepID=A0A372LP19_9BACI|nr:hypothetical protein [Peribacillus saganii]RFU68962.1 hypothetical protein D0469_10775 [Peribacillus saganii]